VIMTGQFMLTTSLPAYTIHIGGTAADAGILAGVFTLAALICRPFLGKLLDSRGRQIVIMIGTAILILSALLYPLMTIIPLLILIRFIHGSGYSAFTTSIGTIVADILPTKRLSEGIAYIGIAGTIATAIGPVLGLYLAGRDFILLFAVLAVLGIIGLIGSSQLNYEKRRQTVASATPKRGKLFEKSALRCALVALCMSLPLDAVMIFIATYGLERGIKSIGLFFPVHAAAMLLSRLLLGRVVDKIGPNRVFFPSMLLGVFAFVMLAFAQSDAVMLVAAFIFGIPIGIAYTIVNAILIRLSPPDSLGAANATFMAFSDIGFGMGSILMGFAIQQFGFTIFFLIAAGCFALAVIVYMALLWSKVRQHHEAGKAAIAAAAIEATKL
jgi:MFS family permease